MRTAWAPLALLVACGSDVTVAAVGGRSPEATGVCPSEYGGERADCREVGCADPSALECCIGFRSSGGWQDWLVEREPARCSECVEVCLANSAGNPGWGDVVCFAGSGIVFDSSCN